MRIISAKLNNDTLEHHSTQGIQNRIVASRGIEGVILWLSFYNLFARPRLALAFQIGQILHALQCAYHVLGAIELLRLKQRVTAEPADRELSSHVKVDDTDRHLDVFSQITTELIGRSTHRES